MSEREKVAKWLIEKHCFEPDDAIETANELLALREPSEPVGWRWYCPGCESGGHGNTEPTHCPDCMEKGVVTRPLYLNPPSRDREAMESIRIYGSDTLSGRVDGPEDAEWDREAVAEMTRRAILGAEDER